LEPSAEKPECHPFVPDRALETGCARPTEYDQHQSGHPVGASGEKPACQPLVADRAVVTGSARPTEYDHQQSGHPVEASGEKPQCQPLVADRALVTECARQMEYDYHQTVHALEAAAEKPERQLHDYALWRRRTALHAQADHGVYLKAGFHHSRLAHHRGPHGRPPERPDSLPATCSKKLVVP